MTGRALAAALVMSGTLYAGAGFATAQQATTPRPSAPAAAEESGIRALHVRGNIWMLAGAGGNITVSVGRDGVLLVDTGLAEQAERVLAAIAHVQQRVDDRLSVLDTLSPKWAAETRLSVLAERDPDGPPKPIRYIVNTHVHPDHTGGNAALRAAGRTFTGGNVAGNIADAGEGAAILAHENLVQRLSANQPPAPSAAFPTDTYYTDGMKLSHFFNGEGVQLLHAPAAHTDGDSLVYFRGSDVIAAGDVYVTTSYPIIDLQRGGSINGVIDALNRILALAIPEFRSEGGTLIIPGHGRISDTADVAYYRDMTTIIRDRVQDMIRRGLSLEQVKAAKPTAEYDGIYAETSGSWTADRFVEAVYRSLSQAPRPAGPGAPATRR